MVRRKLLPLLLVLVGLFVGASASPHESGSAGAAMRGPGAVARGPLERAKRHLAVGEAAEAQAALDEVLGRLRPRLDDELDLLDRDSVVALAREAAGLRVQLLMEGLPVRSGSQRDFVRSIAGEATISDWAWGVPASITLAQAILESNWGRSAPGFNLFGMKGRGPAGSVRRRVVEYHHGRRSRPWADFRAYDDPSQSVRDHGEMVGSKRYYAKAREAGDDVAGFARGLQGSYATDPRYASKLVRMIADLGLGRFDWHGATPVAPPARSLPPPLEDTPLPPLPEPPPSPLADRVRLDPDWPFGPPPGPPSDR